MTHYIKHIPFVCLLVCVHPVLASDDFPESCPDKPISQSCLRTDSRCKIDYRCVRSGTEKQRQNWVNQKYRNCNGSIIREVPRPATDEEYSKLENSGLCYAFVECIGADSRPSYSSYSEHRNPEIRGWGEFIIIAMKIWLRISQSFHLS